MSSASLKWSCIQLGSREHYAIPAALEAAGVLSCLVTDAWVSRQVAQWVCSLAPSMASRRNDGIPDAKVVPWTISRLVFDFQQKLKRASAWTAIMKRNEAFGAWAARRVLTMDASVLFSYSYTARQPFRQFTGLKLLGQIDPGPREQEVVANAARAYEKLALPESLPPDVYWCLWREEVELADRIVVNSSWSAQLLSESGVPRAKMVEIPLVYAPKALSDEKRVTIDESEGKKPRRRLQALFLGSVILRKGAGQLFDAIRVLKDEPIDFTLAGPVDVRIPDNIRGLSHVRFLGPVDRASAERLYTESDVFLFPTLSDGFGLTQLEALGHGCPVIASTHCGQVVDDGVNGLVLEEVTPEAIAEAIMSLVRDRDLLARLKAGARVPDKFHPRHLAPALLGLEKE